MSVGPMGGLAASVAAMPLAQAAGADVERAQQATNVQERRAQNDVRAESAAGIGQADGEDHQTGERDANGRRPWEQVARSQNGPSPPADSRSSKDASHQSGNLVDLTG